MMRGAAGDLADQGLVDRVRFEIELGDRLGQGQTSDGRLVFDPSPLRWTPR